MPGRSATSPSRRPLAKKAPARPTVTSPRRALIVIDQRRLQGAAWAEFHTARKRLEKAARDLHRHEEIDSPAYESWLHRTFPLLVTRLREMRGEADTKARRIQMVQAMAYTSGRSPKRLWREQLERDKNPTPTGESEADADAADDDGAIFPPTPSPERSGTARDIYRRLVQRLHPDRGGDWTPARERLWHEVQQAWAAADTDWLARLEVDWETAHEVLGPTSPVSRLYRAIEELHAARRDTERKLREYRSSSPWRFTMLEHKREFLLRRTEQNLQTEIEYLDRELRHLNTLIASWEEDWTRADSRTRHRRRRSTRY